jgi:hypothetical protein
LSCSDVESLDGTLLVSPVNLTRYTQAAFYPQSYPQGHPLAYLTPAIAGRYLRSPLSYPQAIGAGRHTGLELRLYGKLYDMKFGGQLAARLEPLVVWMSVSCGQLRKLAAPGFLSAKIEIMNTVIHLLTEPDHLMYLAAVAVMWIGKTDRRWFWLFTSAGLTWVVLSHIFIG